MFAEPVSIVYELTLNEQESQVFKRKLPSDNTIEMLGSAVTEGEADMDIHIYSDRIVMDFTFYLTDTLTYSAVKSEMKRIVHEMEMFINEPE